MMEGYEKMKQEMQEYETMKKGYEKELEKLKKQIKNKEKEES